jgi:hypothetical protein
MGEEVAYQTKVMWRDCICEAKLLIEMNFLTVGKRE